MFIKKTRKNLLQNSRFLIFSSLIFLVLFRYFSVVPKIKNGDRVLISSFILSEPRVYERSQSFRVLGVLVYLPRIPEISYGDYVEVEGIYERGKIKNGRVVKIQKEKVAVGAVRKKIISFFNKTLPYSESALIAGIVMGSKSSFSDEIYESFKKAGVTHTVVASGTNVSFTAAFLLSFLVVFVKRKWAVVFSLFAVWVYVFLSGVEGPLVRAAIMISFAFLGQLTGRVNSALNSLVISLFVMLLINPLWIFDIGFILSFAATLSLILFESKVNSKLYFVPTIFREGLSTSISAQIGVLPVLYIAFGGVNPLSPLINALILWTVPFIMSISFVSSILLFIYEPLAKIVLYTSIPFSKYFLYIVSIFS